MKSSPIALSFTDAGKPVPPDEGMRNPGKFVEHFQELPIPYGRFNPVLTRRFVPPSCVKIGVSWFYMPAGSDDDLIPLPDAPAWLDGMQLPPFSIFLSAAPRWVRLGLEYARAYHAPLFKLSETVATGVVTLATSHPESFLEFACDEKISSRARKDFHLAAALAEWDMLERLGKHVTEKERIYQFAQLTGADISTPRAYERIKQVICRGMRDLGLRDRKAG